MPQGEGVFNASLDPKGAPVVCVGLSVGGTAPLKTVFQRLSPTTSMAFVVISHVSRTGPSWLPSFLSHWSPMPSEVVHGGQHLKANHIYVIPPGREITVRDGYFGSRPRSKLRGWSNVVTLFLDSLVKFRKPPGIAVILSGLDADGAAALEAFHKRGGIYDRAGLEVG
jgi:two-component system CheB/CheR fusion protein